MHSRVLKGCVTDLITIIMAGITPRQKISATGSIVYEEKIGMHVEKTRIRRAPFHAVFSGEFFIYYFGVSYSSIVHFSIGCCYLPFLHLLFYLSIFVGTAHQTVFLLSKTERQSQAANTERKKERNPMYVN